MRAFLAALLLFAVLVRNSQAQSSETATLTTAPTTPTATPTPTLPPATTPAPTIPVPSVPYPIPPNTPTAWQWLQANAASTVYYQTILGINQANPVLGGQLIALLNGTAGPYYPYYVTVFLPANATTVTPAQIQLSIVVAYNGVDGPVFYNSSTDGAILTTTYVEPLLGVTFPGSPLPAGAPGQQAIKLGKIGSTYTVLASPNVVPVTISTSDILVSNGAIQIYTSGSVLTPAGNAQTVLSNLQPAYSGFFTQFIQAISGVQGGWAALNNLTSAGVTGSIGYTLLLPTNNGLITLEGNAGKGIPGYLTTAGGAQGAADFASIFSYHIIPSPGEAVNAFYSPRLKGVLTSFGGAYNYSTGLLLGLTYQQLQLSFTSGNLYATSFATFTGPTEIGGVDIISQATVPLDLIIGNGVAHGLQGLLLPPAIQILLPKVILGGGFSNLTHYLALTNLTAALNNAASPFTVLAPTDSAFLAFVANYPTLASNITVLTEILTLHVISGLKATTIGTVVGSLPNATYTTLLSGGSVVVGAANSSLAQTVTVLNGGSSATLDATQTSLAQNGYVYSINTVLLPASLDTSTPTPTAIPTATSTAVPTSTTTAVPTPTRTNPPTSPPTAPNATPTPTGNASLMSMSVVGVIAAVFVALAFRA